MTSSRPGWTRLALLAVATAVSISSFWASLAVAAPYGAGVGAIRAHSTRATESARSLAAAERAVYVRANAVHILEGRKRHLARCMQRHPGRCAVWQTAVQRAARRLSLAETRLAGIRTAPVVTLSGQTLSWTSIAGVSAFIVKRRLANGREMHWLVYGSSLTPPAVEGEAVEYFVRTAARNSEWSTPVTISYPATTPPSGESGSGAGSGSGPGGGSGSGSEPGSGTEKEKAREEKAKEVEKAKEEKALEEKAKEEKAKEEKAKQEKAKEEKAKEEKAKEEKAKEEKAKEEKAKEEREKGSGGAGNFETGVVPTTLAGSEPATIKALGAGSVRMEFPIGSPASALAPAVEAYARVGLRVMPLAGFYASMPSPAEARNLASWATTYGPGGSFWAGKGFPASVAVTDIEFGNETSYSYQYSENSPSAYAARAQTYALRFKEAEIAVKAVQPAVGLLAQADDAGSGSPAWVNNMFAAVPDLASRVAGWTVHPYGTTWQQKMDNLVNFTAANGAPSTIPIYVTELGIAVDNGHCVSNNYGWNPCMSNAEAATTMATVFTGMRTRYAGRLKALYLYQAQDEKPEGTSNEREFYFGLVQSNGAAKGAYTAEAESVLASGGQSMGLAGKPAAKIASVRSAARIAAVHRKARRRGHKARRTRRKPHTHA